ELAKVLPGAPTVDFTRERAVLVAIGPRSSSGYALEVRGVTERRRRIVVSVSERSPGSGERVRPRVTYPLRLLALPRGGKPVEVER
ncbi:MAG: protease complex subunit PrcB family protein, partial [Gaiellaceae bacterium]